MKYKSIGKFPRHSENPFVEKAINEMVVKKVVKVARAGTDSNKSIQTVVNSDGEITGHTQFLQYVEVDEAQFTKIYLSQFAAFWDLGKAAIRVFGYIMTKLKPKKDVFTFRMDQCLSYTKYTHENSVISGLAQLVECGIIARSKYNDEYFLNPLVAFNGDRVTFAKQYVKKKKIDPNQIEIFGEVKAAQNLFSKQEEEEEKE
jgi:hypothetical protein